MERKKVVQCTASKIPAAASVTKSRPDFSLMLSPLYLKRAYMEMLAKNTRPSAIITAGCPAYLAKRPERPKRTTAMCISRRLLVFSFIQSLPIVLRIPFSGEIRYTSLWLRAAVLSAAKRNVRKETGMILIVTAFIMEALLSFSAGSDLNIIVLL